MNNFLTISGQVIEGQKIARKLGYPTINLNIDNDLPLKFGIYAGFMEYNSIIYPGVISYGITPHFAVNKPKFEIHLFNFNQNLYGKIVSITPTLYLREEIKFKDVDSLIKQIKQDCIDSNNHNNNNSFHKFTKSDKLTNNKI